jgi:ABC-type transport system substrate-binding protein
MKTRKEISHTPIALLLMLVVSMFTVIPVSAFINPDGTVDNNSELFGPRVDQIQFKMYATTTAMWTAMDLGEIDLCDWPLTTAWRQTFAANPDVTVVSTGGGAAFFTIDFNMDPYPIIPNGPGRANPVYTSASGGYTLGIPPISYNEHFRWACLKLWNRTLFNQILGTAGIPILTPVPSSMGGYIWSAPVPAPAPDYAAATAELNAGGIKNNTGTWYWDYDGNNIPHANEIAAAQIDMTWRLDTYRQQAGVQLFTELGNMGFTVTGVGLTGGQNYQKVMLDKNYHITTLGWINIGPDPDYLYDLYHGNNFWDDPESACPNTADLNDTVLNAAAEGIKFATTQAAAVTAAMAFQWRFWAICAQIPLYSPGYYVASSKYYTGGNDGVLKTPDDGENQYRLKDQLVPTSRREWLGFCNVAGVGSNNWFTEVNAWPNCTLYGNNGNMTLRYGWSSQDYPKHINPFYSEWYWDSMVLGVLYDSMGYRDPYDVSQWKPDLVKNWTVGLWLDPVTGTNKSKVTVTLRPDIYWSDGKPITIADVVFSMVESTPLLIQYGNSPPWWWPTAELVKSLTIIDAYTVEILYDVQSFFALDWTLGGFYIVPEHIWKPLITSGTPMNAFAPDPNFINSGPFRYLQFTPQSSLVVVANTAGRTITTDRQYAVPITSTYGYHNYCPVYVDVHADDCKARFNLPSLNQDWMLVNLTVTLLNKWLNSSGYFTNLNVNKNVTLDGTLLVQDVPVVLTPGVPDVEVFNGQNLTVGLHNVTATAIITGPAYIDPIHLNPWIGQVISVTLRLYITIKEDIAGSTFYDDIGDPAYPYKSELPTPDFQVDMHDYARASYAFGAYPGHPRWDSVCDVNNNYQVTGTDLALIWNKYGWRDDSCLHGNHGQWPQPQPVQLIADTNGKTIVCKNQNLTVNVRIVNVTDLYDSEIRVSYDNTRLEFAGCKIISPFSGSASVRQAYIAIYVTGNWETWPFSGNATIAQLNFTGSTKGNVTIDPAQSDLLCLSGSSIERIPFTPVPAQVNVTMEGDITGGSANPWDFVPDGKVGGVDVSIVSRCFGSWPGCVSPMIWNANCDLNNNGKVDGMDVAIAARHFGESDP